MESHPVSPQVWHYWLKANGGHGPPTPAVVVEWQYSPVHNATDSGWLALVVTIPYGTAVLLQWVRANRLIPVRDPAVADA